jgi:hypothetical protein
LLDSQALLGQQSALEQDVPGAWQDWQLPAAQICEQQSPED